MGSSLSCPDQAIELIDSRIPEREIFDVALLKRNDGSVPRLYRCSEEKLPVGSRVATLLDILSSQQFQTIILHTLGLDTQQIADLLETSDRTVCRSLSDCLVRAECRSLEDLAARLHFENENELYDVRLKKELAELQSAARRMLESIVSANYAIC